ncbi:hypothetical protein QYF61_018947 [Mycteria americana]|uniref:Uncharacterized protein n=1 Tax=Mycteria americana TaxID=33587 RepID=A0AAN7NUX6_MYCAM|nr:hypothetical protein QYF61_018947 [Mycteria americana]
MSRQLLQENAVGDSVKGFTTVQVDNIYSLSLIHRVGHLVVEGDQVGQAGPAFHEPMLAGPDPLVGLHMSVECTQDEPLHNFSWYRESSTKADAKSCNGKGVTLLAAGS